MANKCQGCGAEFQFTEPQLIGYIERKVYQQSQHPLCQRCFRTIHYNDVSKVVINDFNYQELFEKVKMQKAVVVLVVDVFDLNHTTLMQYQNDFKNLPLIILANKYDLLSHVLTTEKLLQYLQKYFKRCKYSYLDMIIYSAFSNQDAKLLQTIFEKYPQYSHFYFVGASNVGKSSIINQLLKKQSDINQELTTSNFYQTTVGEIEISFAGKNIIDTPGVILKNSFTNYLSKETLEKITPKKPLKPKVYQLQPYQTIFINNFIIVNFLQGKASTFVFYCENNLYLHRTKFSQACKAYSSLQKTLLKLPTAYERENLGERIKTVVNVSPDLKQDIVFPGLGFVSISGEATVEIVHYENIKIYVREAMI